MTTTIAVKESTVEKLKRLMKIRHMASLDQTINSLIESAENAPSSMFGADKRRHLMLTDYEHEEFQGECLATARARGARVITGDKHFDDLKDSIKI